MGLDEGMSSTGMGFAGEPSGGVTVSCPVGGPVLMIEGKSFGSGDG